MKKNVYQKRRLPGVGSVYVCVCVCAGKCKFTTRRFRLDFLGGYPTERASSSPATCVSRHAICQTI